MSSNRSTLLSTHFDFEQLVKDAVNTALSVTLPSLQYAQHMVCASPIGTQSDQWRIDEDPDPLHWTDVD